MSIDNTITSIFECFHEDLVREQEKRDCIRGIVKDLDQTARQMVTILMEVHKPAGLKRVDELTSRVKQLIENKVVELHTKLYEALPKTEFYRYHDHWKFSTQKLIFVVSFIEFLTNDRLLLWQQAAASLSLTVNRNDDKLYLDLEDYLHGLITLANELSRLAVNSVTSADYNMPLKIASFLADLESGFRLLNLKNDNLRKRFDSIKYDMKKVEEVVYDISIRGLTAPTEQHVPETPAGDVGSAVQ